MKDSSSAFSVLDLFTIGIGPSSSHTVGPMRAAATFASSLASLPVQMIRCDLFGSLADTGRGHGTDTAVILGFMGYDPRTIPIDEAATILSAVDDQTELILPDRRRVGFTRKDHIVFHRGKNLGEHPNAMHFTALAKDGRSSKRMRRLSALGRNRWPELTRFGRRWTNVSSGACDRRGFCPVD